MVGDDGLRQCKSQATSFGATADEWQKDPFGELRINAWPVVFEVDADCAAVTMPADGYLPGNPGSHQNP